MVVSTVYAAANHCRLLAHGFPQGACISPPKWRKALRDDWRKRKGAAATPARDRYEREEAQALISNLDKAEPRLALALVLGTGYRVQQIAENARRSNLVTAGIYGRRLTFVDQKRGETTHIDLTPRQQASLLEAMETGYLTDLETAFREGEIADYFLIAGNRLRRGRAQVKYASQPYGRRALGKRMTDFEENVGVTHVPKRLFHGLRRAMEAFIAEQTTDEAVRDLAGGWKIGGGTREAVYSSSEDEARLAAAAHARAAAFESMAGPKSSASMIDTWIEATRHLASEIATATEILPRPRMDDALDACGELLKVLEVAASELAAPPQKADQNSRPDGRQMV